MYQTTIAFLVGSLGFLMGIGLRAEPTTPSDVTQLVRQLGSISFRERETASRLLNGLGDRALPALYQAIRSRDAEVRRRSIGLVQDIERRQYREIHCFAGLMGPVTAVTFSADGRYILSGGNDCTIRLWDTTSGRELRRMEVHWETITTIRFSPDGHRAVSGDDDGRVRYWNVDTGKELRHFKGHKDRVHALCYSPDGKRILSAGDDSTIRVWKADTGMELGRYSGRGGAIYDIKCSPNGKHVLAGYSDGTIALWDLSGGKELWRVARHEGAVCEVGFSANGKLALSVGGRDFTVWVSTVTEGKGVRSFTIQKEELSTLAFCENGRWMLTGNYDGDVTLWDISTGTRRLQRAGHSRKVSCACFSPDGSRAVSGGMDMTVRLWALPK